MLDILSKQHVVDMLTKGLNTSASHNLITMFGMEDIYSLAWEGKLKYRCKYWTFSIQ